jgi:thiamine-monophosphate kinase
LNEDERVGRIAAILGRSNARVGIGDDAAVLDAPNEPIVWTIDEQVEDVHFRRQWCSLRDIGYRATMAAASDLAAMGARPIGALAAIVVPTHVEDGDLDEMAEGQREACDRVGAGVVGGNLSRGERLSIATTWLGACDRPILRSGAQVGDGLYLCGDVGLAGAGLRALEASAEDDAPPDALQAWRRPIARIAEGLVMARVASAAIDVSDGLARDAGHVALASGVRIVIDEVALREHLHPATLAIAQLLRIDALELGLGGGEDYALVCTAGSPIEGFTRIGSVAEGSGVFLRAEGGAERAVSAGFDHFQSP